MSVISKYLNGGRKLYHAGWCYDTSTGQKVPRYASSQREANALTKVEDNIFLDYCPDSQIIPGYPYRTYPPPEPPAQEKI